MTELKPCPFCGGKAVKIVYWDEEEQNVKVWEHGCKQDENHYYVIRCYDCDIQFFGGVPISGYELIEAWNRRAEDVQPVKRGRWIWNSEPESGNSYGSYRCSECGNRMKFQEIYCCGCGARMAEEDENETD